MLPSRKIFVGASALITSTLLQYLVDEHTQRAIETANVATGTDPKSGLIGPGTSDQMLEHVHTQMGTSLVGQVLCMGLMVGGVIILVIGLYQAARLAERVAKQLDSRP